MHSLQFLKSFVTYDSLGESPTTVLVPWVTHLYMQYVLQSARERITSTQNFHMTLRMRG